MQENDTRLDQLAHRRRTLPEHAKIEQADSDLRRLRDLLVAAETERSDIEREQTKAEADVSQVRQRAARDQQRLDSGQVGSPRELQNLQSEIVSLARRQAELEDVELAVMERMEDVEQHIARLRADIARVENERDEVVSSRDVAVSAIEDEVALTSRARDAAAGDVDGALLTLYEKVRAQQGGVGAAALRQRRCLGCHIELNNTDINRIVAAEADEVLRCEECRRILVRTAESGI